MGAFKAPRKDGFQSLFYQKCWETVGNSLVEFVIACFSQPEIIRAVNETLLVLIPKKESLDSLNMFRLISLCNAAYKTVAKCVVQRIQPLMRHLVHPTQTSFVPGCHISSNIIIVQEVVHSMGLKKGQKGQMILNVDLAKAYDRPSWEFIRDT
ncbi:unnamed protein product [Linum trigynum]|uniref:Reverse transcriptase domain-containing protein n=1 Tax=Linum trigynum TaxID=586398 RepID=A0AAV2G8K6_9ROSI